MLVAQAFTSVALDTLTQLDAHTQQCNRAPCTLGPICNDTPRYRCFVLAVFAQHIVSDLPRENNGAQVLAGRSSGCSEGAHYNYHG